MIDSIVFDLDGTLWDTCADGLRALIERNGLRHTLLVGDTPGDQAAARECHVPFLYVDYGFGVCRDADRRFSSFRDLTDWLLGEASTTPSHP